MPMRLTLRPFTFSNGVTIPAGTVVALPVHAIHTDKEIHPNAEEFDGFRFEKLRHKVDNNTMTRHQPIATSGELLTFGLGRHAW
jgi:cytochrome P450